MKMAPFENLQTHLGSKNTKKLTADAPQEVPLGCAPQEVPLG